MHLGDVIADRFELLAPAGAGSMGTVYRAQDRLTGETVALKVLRGAAAGPERFAREARLLAELSHPGIVRYVAHGALAGASRWLAMEWLEGEDLAARLARDRLSAAESVELARRVAVALGAAHERGVVHRDVKPANLFLVGGEVDRVKVLDFGVARVGGALASHAVTRTGAMLGTPGYMAPEQAEGDADVDARADVFSIGCVLFECVTGRPAFQGAHVVAVLAKILLEDAPRLDEILPDAPVELADLVARMLDKAPDARPRDGTEAAGALAALSAIPSLRPVAPAATPPSLTPEESRIVSVVLVTGVAAKPEESTSIREAARRLRTEVQPLADGSIVCLFDGADAAVRAAQLALAVESAARVAVATGRARVSSPLPVGHAIDRAASLVRSAGSRARVDDVTAALIVERFELDGHALVRERAQATAARTLLGKPTTCVGRRRELAVLRGYWDECVDEPRSRPVLVTAPAGTGKSRLRYEIVRALRAEGTAEIWIARGDASRAGSPLEMIRQAVMGTAAMRSGEPREALQKKLRARVAQHVPEGEREHVTTFLGELTGADFADDDRPALRAARRDALIMSDNVRTAWEDFVRAECAARPLLLVLEDLHWGDGATVSYVDGALRNLGELPCMVLALARPEIHDLFPKLWAEREMQEVTLGPLSRKASEELARQVLGHDAEVSTIVERAAGNAFFLEELIRARARGEGDAAPESVLAIVEHRLLELDAEARRVLRAASVLGATFWEGAVAALLGGADPREWLRVLSDMEIVHARSESRFSGERELAFRHDLVRAAAYGMLTDDDRALGHRLVAEWLESAGERNALIVADHWERAGERARAIPWLLRSAEQALDGSEHAEAIERAERGARCGAEGETLAALRYVQATAHVRAGELDLAADRAKDATTLVSPAASGWMASATLALSVVARLGRRAETREIAEALERAVATPGARTRPMGVLWRAALALLIHGDADTAARLAMRAGEPDDTQARAWRALYRANTAAHAGDMGEHLHESEDALSHFELAGDRRREADTLGSIGYALAELGQYERAEDILRRALARSRAMAMRNAEATFMHNLGPILAALGRIDEGLTIEREAVSAFEAQGDRVFESGSRLYLSEMLCATGQLADAHDEADRAVRALAQTRWLRPYGLAILARVERAAGQMTAARAAANEAVAALDGAQEREATIRLEWAEILHATGDHDAARAAITTARDRLLARAARISDPTLRESFLTRVPDHARSLELAREWA